MSIVRLDFNAFSCKALPEIPGDKQSVFRSDDTHPTSSRDINEPLTVSVLNVPFGRLNEEGHNINKVHDNLMVRTSVGMLHFISMFVDFP